MKTRLQIDKKASSQFKSATPSTQLLQTRPFNNIDNSGSSSLAIQTKMTIGEPNDKYEQEADQVASQVVNQINQPPSVQTQEEEEMMQTKPDSLQRQEEEEEMAQAKFDSIQRQEEEEEMMQPKLDSIQRQEEEEEMMQTKPDSLQRQEEEEEMMQTKPDSIQRQEEEEEMMQPKLDSIQRQAPPDEEDIKLKPDTIQRAETGAMTANPSVESSISQQRGQGTSLPKNVRKPMEQVFGADFTGVKVHHNSESDQLNQSIQARAFTTGQDLFFRQGAYNPDSRDGQELLAHELTHVVQQNGSNVQKKKDD